MKGAIRSTRGRPSKVTKASSAPGAAAAAAAAAKRARGLAGAVSPGKAGGQYPELDDMNAATAAAAAAAVAEMGEAEADGEMEEDDDQQQHHHHHPHHHDPTAASGLGVHDEHVDLNTAANILANGGGGGGGASSANVIGIQDHATHNLANAAHQPPAPMGNPQQSQPQQQQQLVPGGDHSSHVAAAAAAAAAAAHNMDPSFVKATEEMARESGYGTLNVDSGLAKRLAREPGLRLAQQRRPDQQLNLARRSNVEALYAHIAGELAPSSCKNCHKGHGPWTSCVVVDGQMCGSCANCWFNASGARCSFHETRNPQAIHHQSSLLAAAAAGGSGSPQDHSSSFALSQPLSLPHGGSHTSTLASLGISAPMSNDPVLRYTIDRALNDVRAADRKTRQIMMVEIAAKQLALQILEYEETVAAEQHSGGPSQGGHQQQGGGGGMGGDGGPGLAG